MFIGMLGMCSFLIGEKGREETKSASFEEKGWRSSKSGCQVALVAALNGNILP